MKYDVVIIGAGPGGIFAAQELVKWDQKLKIAIFDAGYPLEKRHCPIDGQNVKTCIQCETCSIMNGFGGAGAYSDGKYNITNDFGGTLYEHIGKENALTLMKEADEVNYPGLLRRHEASQGLTALKDGHTPSTPY